MLRKDDPAFKKVVDDATADALQEPGEINAIYDKWFVQADPAARASTSTCR